MNGGGLPDTAGEWLKGKGSSATAFGAAPHQLAVAPASCCRRQLVWAKCPHVPFSLARRSVPVERCVRPSIPPFILGVVILLAIEVTARVAAAGAAQQGQQRLKRVHGAQAEGEELRASGWGGVAEKVLGHPHGDWL